MTLLQLDPPIPVDTPKGQGFAFGWLDYGQEHDCLWKVCVTATGEWWDVPQPQVRGVENVSMGRMLPCPPTRYVEQAIIRAAQVAEMTKPPIRFVGHRKSLSDIPWMHCKKRLADWFEKGLNPGVGWVRIDYFAPKGWIDPANDNGPLTD